MVRHEPKACQFCRNKFAPHPKVGRRQIACTKPECQRARKRANLQKFYSSDVDYNYDNVKRYRARHPDYQKQWRQKHKEARLISPAILMPPSSRQRIPASLFVSSESSEIQTELSPVKTVRPYKRARPQREIQTELTLSFSVQLAQLLTSLPEVRYKSS
jgi:hypothetical protein